MSRTPPIASTSTGSGPRGVGSGCGKGGTGGSIGLGSGNGRPEIEREIGLAASRGERVVWLTPGARVRVVRYGAAANFASQVAPLPETGARSVTL